jgi:hypothetical protein
MVLFWSTYGPYISHAPFREPTRPRFQGSTSLLLILPCAVPSFHALALGCRFVHIISPHAIGLMVFSMKAVSSDAKPYFA